MVCSGFTTQTVEIMRISNNDGQWKVRREYSVELFYSPILINRLRLSFISDRYLAFILISSNLMSEGDSTDSICLMLYRLNPETGSGEIFYVLRKTDLTQMDNFSYFKLIDLILREEQAGQVKLYLLAKTITDKQEKNSGHYSSLALLDFNVEHFKIEYMLDSINFHDELQLILEDFLGNKYEADIKIVIIKNAKVYFYIIINAVLFFVLCILCIVTFCIYRKRKLEKLMRQDSFYSTNSSQFDSQIDSRFDSQHET